MPSLRIQREITWTDSLKKLTLSDVWNQNAERRMTRKTWRDGPGDFLIQAKVLELRKNRDQSIRSMKETLSQSETRPFCARHAEKYSTWRSRTSFWCYSRQETLTKFSAANFRSLPSLATRCGGTSRYSERYGFDWSAENHSHAQEWSFGPLCCSRSTKFPRMAWWMNRKYFASTLRAFSGSMPTLGLKTEYMEALSTMLIRNYIIYLTSGCYSMITITTLSSNQQLFWRNVIRRANSRKIEVTSASWNPVIKCDVLHRRARSRYIGWSASGLHGIKKFVQVFDSRPESIWMNTARPFDRRSRESRLRLFSLCSDFQQYIDEQSAVWAFSKQIAASASPHSGWGFTIQDNSEQSW